MTLFGRPFRDREDAGRQLARRLTAYARNPATLVLALPRGGVPVAFEVARALDAPLDVFVVRKLGVPGHEDWRWVRSRPADFSQTTDDEVRDLLARAPHTLPEPG